MTFQQMQQRSEAAKKAYPPRKWSELTKDEQDQITRTCSVWLLTDTTDETLYGKNSKGEWCCYAK